MRGIPAHVQGEGGVVGGQIRLGSIREDQTGVTSLKSPLLAFKDFSKLIY